MQLFVRMHGLFNHTNKRMQRNVFPRPIITETISQIIVGFFPMNDGRFIQNDKQT